MKFTKILLQPCYCFASIQSCFLRFSALSKGLECGAETPCPAVWLSVRCPPPSAGTVATGPGMGGSAAAGAEMAAGVHCAHFTLRKADSDGFLPQVGAVGAGFDATGDQAATRSAEGWMLAPGSSYGSLWHGGKDSDWAGKAAAEQLKAGDVVVRSHPPPCPLPAAGG